MPQRQDMHHMIFLAYVLDYRRDDYQSMGGIWLAEAANRLAYTPPVHNPLCPRPFSQKSIDLYPCVFSGVSPDEDIVVLLQYLDKVPCLVAYAEGDNAPGAFVARRLTTNLHCRRLRKCIPQKVIFNSLRIIPCWNIFDPHGTII